MLEDAVSDELEQLGIAKGRYNLAPLSKIHRFMAQRLTAAARDVPHFALVMHIPMQPLLDARAAFNDQSVTKVSINDFLIAAVARTLVAVPEVNSSFTDHGIVRHHHADIAVAVAGPAGLITPIVRDAEALTIAQLSQVMRDLADRAQRRRLQPDEYTGGSFCISNLGMFGIHSFGSIINPPHGAILSVGAVEERVVASNGVPAVARMVTLTLTCDHRVIDGATGARWLAELSRTIAHAAEMK